MGTIKATFDPTGLNIFKRATMELSGKRIRSILHFALDQQGAKLSTNIRREVVKQSTIPRSEVDRVTRNIQSSTANLTYTIESLSHHEPLSKSFFRPTQHKGGVAATAWATRRTFPSTFLFGGWAFKRSGKSRALIWGPSVADEMERGGAEKFFDNFKEHTLPEAIDRKLGQYMP